MEPAPKAVAAADMDLDGDLDLVAMSSTGFEVDWWENTAGDGSAWTQRSIHTGVGAGSAVAVGDLDGDGDPDLVGTDSSGDQVAWWENKTLHRSALFTTKQVASAISGAFSVHAADVDDDGDFDLVVAAFGANDIARSSSVSRASS